jgi:hypothetical protein
MDELKFYGIYQGICADVDDPEKDSRIKLQVPQVMGEEITEWARPCLPVTSNSNHPDHKKHLAAEVAALLLGHGDHSVSVSGTTGSGGTPSHTHSFSATQTLSHTNNHTGNSLSLDHEHETAVDKDNKWNDDQETNQTPEHTPHRLVPRVGQKVWVMFVGGDPNYPVWMGVELDG